MNNIINLNTHSYYSFLSSTLSIDDIISFALKNHQEYVSLIDKNVLYGAIEFYKNCKKNNLKPIIGIQIDYNDDQLILIAKNNFGYKKLVKISSCIMLEKQIDLYDYLDENLFLISLNNNFKWNHSNFFTSQPGFKNSIAVHEVKYFDEHDYLNYLVVKSIKNDTHLSKYNLNLVDNKFGFWTSSQISDQYDQTSISNLIYLVSSINWELEIDYCNNIIKYPLDNQISSQEYLKNQCYLNLNKYLKNHNLIDQSKIYFDRLNYELSIINKKGFNDYFLVVSDFINWAKSNEIIIGPGRGSAAGSLVSFCMNITEIDPIKYNLLFERFLNDERSSMPDIDTDIMDTRREEVINYLYEKYGNNHVCNIITFSKIKAKQAIRDLGRVFEINQNIIDKICKNIPIEHELNIFNAIENNFVLQQEFIQLPFLFNIANRLINIPRQSSIHAAGIVLSNANLDDVIPIQKTNDGKVVSQFSMEYLEEHGLIKMDLLGLRNLTIIYYILKLIKYIHHIDIDLNEINLNDQNVFKMFCDNKTNGIFQFESFGMKKILKRMQPKSIEDLSLVSAMYRPGALNNIDIFFKRKNSNIQPKYISKEIEQILSPTYGAFIYQEQIIELVKKIANFSGAKSDSFRRAIAKKQNQLLLQLKQDFINGATINNYTITQSNELYHYIEKFGGYGFNHSHSISYALLSYWMGYLKYYYPLETISVLLSYGDNSKDKMIGYINDAKYHHIDILPPDINQSTDSFIIVNKNILFSLLAISGIGHETIKKIITIRNSLKNQTFDSATKCISLLSNNGISMTTIELLIKSGCFDKLEPRRNFLLVNLDLLTNKKMNILDQQMNFVFELNLNNTFSENIDLYSEWEKQLLGISFNSSHFDKLFQQYQLKYNLVKINENLTDKSINSIIKINQIYKRKSKLDKNILKLNVDQNNKLYTLYVFNDVDIIYDQLNGFDYGIVNLEKYKDTYIIKSVLEVIKK